MARFNAQGIEGLELSMREFAEIPDDVVEEMLEAAGRVVVEAHKRSLLALGLVSSRKLLDSIKALLKVGKREDGWKWRVVVYPAGTHHTYERRIKIKKYKNSKHGRTYTVGGDIKSESNSRVGYVLEYGARKEGIKPYQWMRKANEQCADAVVQAELEVYNKWLKSKNL